MKKFQTRALALVMAMAMVLGLSGMAMAAETTPTAPKGISVQLDGKNLAFTDAVPQVKDQRTFLPVRAVLEAMGAEVSNEGNVITAVRDGKTLTMTIGSTAATMTADGATTDLTMDVAPYVDSATWRTYVPVRFAAEAFDCAVGWDQAAQTAVIVDTEKLVNATTSAYHFTYLDKYMEYSKQFQQGTWAVSGKLDGKLTLAVAEGEKPQQLMTVTATYDGLTAEGTRAQMSMNMKMDMTALIKALSGTTDGAAELTADEKAMLDDLKTNGITMDVRGDIATGMFYVNMSGKLLEAAGIAKDSWISVDFNALLEGSGIDMASLMAAAREFDLNTMLAQAIAAGNVNNSATAYAEVKTAVEQVVKFLADESFVKNGNDYTTSVKVSDSSSAAGISMTLTMKNDKVVGYKLDMDASTTDASMGSVGMKMNTSVDASNKLTAVITLDLGEMGSLEMNMTGAYTASTKTPETQPPEGATVVPFEQLLSTGA